MDPDEALKKARKALAEYRGADSSGDAVFPADELAEAFEVLDAWLTNGGFLPKAWSRKQETLVPLPSGGKQEDTKGGFLSGYGIVVELDCAGTDAYDVVNAVLDNGPFQEAIEAYAADTGRTVHVRAVTWRR